MVALFVCCMLFVYSVGRITEATNWTIRCNLNSSNNSNGKQTKRKADEKDVVMHACKTSSMRSCSQNTPVSILVVYIHNSPTLHWVVINAVCKQGQFVLLFIRCSIFCWCMRVIHVYISQLAWQSNHGLKPIVYSVITGKYVYTWTLTSFLSTETGSLWSGRRSRNEHVHIDVKNISTALWWRG